MQDRLFRNSDLVKRFLLESNQSNNVESQLDHLEPIFSSNVQFGVSYCSIVRVYIFHLVFPMMYSI